MRFRCFVLALALSVPAAAGVSQCSDLLARVDDALAAPPTLDADVLQLVKDLRAEGETQCNGGKQEAATESLTQALLLLGRL